MFSVFHTIVSQSETKIYMCIRNVHTCNNKVIVHLEWDDICFLEASN